MLLDQFASHPGNLDSLQELIDINFELDTKYNERKKEKGSHQEKKSPVTGSDSFRPSQDSSFKNPHNKKSRKGNNFHISKEKPFSSLLNKEIQMISSEKESRIKEGLCTYCGGNHPIEKCFKMPQNRKGSSRGFPNKQGKSWVGIMMCSMVLTYFLQEHNCAL
ncbi:hypothetical protein O181_033075 [Austropuccinia psidii MF-1]|uniref:Uncharacterized protein n=1 Tax=Austropuccinia psidii MF-1 TaxID=1389203 RepID=A0A9Q3H8V4_9BASI|nr:hypothetical protein [Austropuccinia psidii MF-1]